MGRRGRRRGAAVNVTAGVLDIAAGVANGADAGTLLMARICLLDWLGVTIAGAGEPVVERLIACVEHPPRGQGHRLIGRRERLGRDDALLVNGTAGHALDYDDGLAEMSGHPGVAIFPALIAAAQEAGGEPAGWDDFLRAAVLGYEVAGRIGLMMAPDHYARGHHATGTVGAVAAAAACARLLGLDPQRSATALALAATRAGGLKAMFGSDGKPLHAGWAALVGMTAARWAGAGMTAADDILGHTQGFGAAGSQSFDAAKGLGEHTRPLMLGTMFKHHAACGVTHPAIRAARVLRGRAHGSSIAAISIAVSAKADDICNVTAPADGLALKFSIAGVVAMALLGIDTANPSAYSAATCARADWQDLLRRIVVKLEPSRLIGPTVVTVTFVDGRSETHEDHGTEPADPILAAQAAGTKFAALAGSRLGRRIAARIARAIMAAEGTAQTAANGAEHSGGIDISGVIRMTGPRRREGEKRP
jgi:2-methylcitrate dehydratase PrpD